MPCCNFKHIRQIQQKTYNTTYKLHDDFINSCCDFMHNTLTAYAVNNKP